MEDGLSSLKNKRDKYLISLRKLEISKITKKRRKIEMEKLKNNSQIKNTKEFFSELKKIKNQEISKIDKNILKIKIQNIRKFLNKKNYEELEEIIIKFLNLNYYEEFLEILKNEEKYNINILKEIIWLFITIFSTIIDFDEFVDYKNIKIFLFLIEKYKKNFEFLELVF